MEEAKMAALKLAKKELRALTRKKLAEVPGVSVADQSKTAAAVLFSMPQYKAARSIGVYLSMPNGEIMTSAIVKNALAEQKQVFVPYVYKNLWDSGNEIPRKVMDMVSLSSEEDFQKIEGNRDAWGIPTVEDGSVFERRRILGEMRPVVGTDEKHRSSSNLAVKYLDVSYNNLDMIIMPGVVFDRRCGRVGHGKGFYDYFLQRYHDEKALATNPLVPPLGQKGMPFLVGLALGEQVISMGQDVPSGPLDWRLDAVVTGHGAIIEHPSLDDNSGT